MDLTDYNLGDKLVIVMRTNMGTTRSAAIVTAINFQNNGLVTYAGDYHRLGMPPSGQGAFNPTKLRTTKFGICWDVEK